MIHSYQHLPHHYFRQSPALHQDGRILPGVGRLFDDIQVALVTMWHRSSSLWQRHHHRDLPMARSTHLRIRAWLNEQERSNSLGFKRFVKLCYVLYLGTWLLHGLVRQMAGTQSQHQRVQRGLIVEKRIRRGRLRRKAMPQWRMSDFVVQWDESETEHWSLTKGKRCKTASQDNPRYRMS